MTNLNGLQVTYTSPSRVPIGIKVGEVYSIVKIDDKYFVNNVYFSCEHLVTRFSLANGDWDTYLMGNKRENRQNNKKETRVNDLGE